MGTDDAFGEYGRILKDFAHLQNQLDISQKKVVEKLEHRNFLSAQPLVDILPSLLPPGLREEARFFVEVSAQGGLHPRYLRMLEPEILHHQLQLLSEMQSMHVSTAETRSSSVNALTVPDNLIRYVEGLDIVNVYDQRFWMCLI
jgi:hypothetical protein